MNFWWVSRFDAKSIVPVAKEHSLRRLAMPLPQCYSQSQSLRETQKKRGRRKKEGRSLGNRETETLIETEIVEERERYREKMK